MRRIHEVVEALRRIEAPMKIMEVCGTHTASIVKNGIRDLLPENIRLVSGPGCPVCVTPTSVIDELVTLAFQPDCTVLSYGDMFKVRGSVHSLASAKAEGASVRMIYAPFEAISLAKEHPQHTFVVAAVGFETTAPAYALLLEELVAEDIHNVKLLTSLKTMPAVMEQVCREEAVDGFLCPGHVCSVTGSGIFEPLCESYQKPFVVAGFSAEGILCALLEIAGQIGHGQPAVKNFYPSVVSREGNQRAQALLMKYFVPSAASWRGIGIVPDSGLLLRPEWSRFGTGRSDAQPEAMPPGCACTDVILGRIAPSVCPHFGKGCTPQNAMGPCMVSAEGACGIWYEGGER